MIWNEGFISLAQSYYFLIVTTKVVIQPCGHIRFTTLRFSAALCSRRNSNSPFLRAFPGCAANGPRGVPRDPPTRGQVPAQLPGDKLQYPRHVCGCSFNQRETDHNIKLAAVSFYLCIPARRRLLNLATLMSRLQRWHALWNAHKSKSKLYSSQPSGVLTL